MSTFESLELRGVGRRFGGVDALADLDLTIKAGEFVALLGPSGCGKSTALNCLAGLLPLTHGEILLDGKRIDTLPPERRGFGMVFQSYALFPHLSVEKNVAFGLQMQGLPRAQIDARVRKAIELVKLDEHVKKLPGQLSGGQQQRVAIARAVVLEPSLVLMDEPLSNLDAKLRLDMRTEIRRLHQSLGLTTIYVTHDQEEALSLADRLVVLRNGRVQQIGTPDELYESPTSWYVADFMGYRNILPATVVSTSGDEAVVALPGTADGGVRLTGRAVGALSAGDSVRVAIRPDDFSVSSSAAEGLGAGAIPGAVSVVEYQGRELAVGVQTGDTMLHARTPTAPQVGGAVWLTAPVERVLVFPESLDAAVPAEVAA
ncbi:putative spermidine/putrescine transport system ATP-binding protein [Promicromonospora umidemergens]|uniref:ABC transporter ATP-binding protein n=1 Tax=Promicromonospora umidemergens TaxID=629679 RepID=A0ABP8X3C7_9MICO|nr:ABC transporter ATP-binding protein [Promicromonospora umidemergens]MCP2285103.1 putative spermidine/putrescine transport system ATP-binding protein [Promicromonospora umidemergens]